MSNIPIGPWTSANFTTQTDLSDKLYHLGKLSSGLIILGDSKGARVDGVIMEKVKGSTSNELPVEIAISGICLVEAGGNVNEGEQLICDGSGRAIADDGANQFVVGIAQKSGVAGDYISARLTLHPTLTA